jgi:hypothetical protein
MFSFLVLYNLFYVFLSISEQNFRLFIIAYYLSLYCFFATDIIFTQHLKLKVTRYFFHTPHKELMGLTSVLLYLIFFRISNVDNIVYEIPIIYNIHRLFLFITILSTS